MYSFKNLIGMKWGGIILIVIAMIMLGFNFITMWLWNNALVSAVTFAHPITYWQAMGLTILIFLLRPNVPSK